MNIQSIFRSLLVDLSNQTGVFIDSPDDIETRWLLETAPIMYKEMLNWLERFGPRVLPCADLTVPELSLAPSFPEWLTPLWHRFVFTDEPKYLKAMIQILVFCYKIEQKPTNEQIDKACESYRQNEADLEIWRKGFNPESVLFRIARDYVSLVTYKANWSEIECCHGPGAVYPPRDFRTRSFFRFDYKPITELYPIDKHFAVLPSSWEDWLGTSQSDYMSVVKAEISAKLVMVPKDSRGPRTICVHPTEAIWIQQGLRRELERCIKTSKFGKFINFSDQTINQRLALASSKDRAFCTIDLKDASDRLHKDLITELFSSSAKYLNCCRASSVIMNDRSVIELKKWAPMGNCLMFPVESLVFFSLVKAGIQCRHGRLAAGNADVYIYGDDIIVPSKYYDAAVYALSRAGLIPNVTKTYKQGFFRESCGVEAYKGQDVTPHRLRNVSASSAAGAQSLCSLALRLRLAGFEYCSSHIYAGVRKRVGVLPLSNNPSAQGIFEYVPWDLTKLLLHGEGRIRFNADLHTWQIQVRLIRSTNDSGPKCDWNHVQDSILRILLREAPSERKAEYPVPYRERLTYGWSELV